MSFKVRAGRHDMLAAEKRKFAVLFDWSMYLLGARRTPLSDSGWDLQTAAGLLTIRQFNAAVYGEFADPGLAARCPDNPFFPTNHASTGRWSFRFNDVRIYAECALENLLRDLRPLLPASWNPDVGLILSRRGTSFNTMGTSFRDGKKYLDGREVARTRYIYECRSTSNHDTIYVALQYTDGSTSCNCAGWWSAQSRLRQGKGDGHCKHSRAAARLTADVRLRPAATPVPTPIPQPEPAPPTAYRRRMLPRTKLDD